MASSTDTHESGFTFTDRAWFDSYRPHEFDRSGRHVKRPGSSLALIIWGRLTDRMTGWASRPAGLRRAVA